MRVLIDIPDEHLASLDALAKRNGRSRAAEVRDAVMLYLGNRAGKDWIQRGFGYWKDRDDLGDAAGQHEVPQKKSHPRMAPRVHSGL